jgi:pilus assembly protein CpaE
MPNQEPTKLTGNWNALFIGPNPKTKRDLTPLLTRHLGNVSAAEFSAFPARHQLAEWMTTPEQTLCFIDMAADLERALAFIPELLRQAAKLPIISILDTNNPDMILRCLRQGAMDFLVQPFTEDQVEAAGAKIARLQPGRAGKTGRVFCIMPAKGGCGAITIACNLAYQWKRLGAKSVLLADLDPMAGTLSFTLKVKSNYSFLDALQRTGDMDEDLWKAMVVNRQGVDVLLAPEVMFEGASDLGDAGPVIEYARTAYDIVLLDAGGVYGEWNLSQANRCDELLLITTNELTSLQAVQRALNYLDANGIGRWKVRLIVNRYDRHLGLSRDVIGTALHSDIYHILPSDFEAIQKSLMEGKPIPPTTSLGKSIIGLADRLAGREGGAKKGSSLSGLLSLFSRTSS